MALYEIKAIDRTISVRLHYKGQFQKASYVDGRSMNNKCEAAL
ncbi:hypothetical protein OROMI_031954 [Orobanche minor]